MTKLLLAATLLFCSASAARAQAIRAEKIKNRHVNYAARSGVRRYPLPPVLFEREGLAKKGDQREIIEKIIYPIINKSKEPVAAFIVEFSPDSSDISITVIWHVHDSAGNVQYVSSMVSRNSTGRFDADAYLLFFPDEEDAP